MNISFKWCNKTTECAYCGKFVEKDTPIFVHGWKNKHGFTGRVFYHPVCFITHFTTLLELKVPKPSRQGRGRPNMGLTAEEKKKRAILLRTYPKIMNDPIELGYVKVALQRLGGIPKSWEV